LPSGGVRGVKLQGEGDGIVGAFPMPNNAQDNQWIWNITNDGIAKISRASEYPTQGRAGQGVISMRLPEMSAGVAAATVGHQNDNIIVLTSKNKPKYMRIGLAEEVTRGRSGYNEGVISLREGEEVTRVVTYQPLTVLPAPEETEPVA
jgi:DNA gyrase subunit A